MPIDVYKEWLGIPEGPRPPDYYALLRLVQFEDDVDKIRKNYKKLNGHVRKYATGDYSVESQDLLNELAKAMLCLTDSERKQEYDRGQGREIDDRDAATGRRPVTAYLADQGVLSAEQVQAVKTHAEKTGLSLRDSVVQLKLADAETVARAWASESVCRMSIWPTCSPTIPCWTSSPRRSSGATVACRCSSTTIAS